MSDDNTSTGPVFESFRQALLFLASDHARLKALAGEPPDPDWAPEAAAAAFDECLALHDAELKRALREAIVYVESMRLVPGGVRDRLRLRWRALLVLPAPER